MTTRLLLVRHGQTDWNLTHRIQGSVDIPLNETGLAQAAATRDAFASRPFDVLVSSHLERARVTAAHINEPWALEHHIDERLTERGHGPFEGWTWKEVVAHVGEEHADHFFQHSPELEGWSAVKQRMLDVLHETASSVGSGTAVVVSHGGSIRAVVAEITGVHHRSTPSLFNCSVTELRYDRTWSVVDYNNNEHLPEALRT